VPVCASRLAVNWSRSNSYWGTFLCRRQSATWDAYNHSGMR
jgi:hypothetical protein